MGIIRVIDHSGNTHQLDAVEGWRVTPGQNRLRG